METLLITGVAGFIGSSVARLFISKGYQVIGVDNLSTGSISQLPEGIIFVKGDLSQETTFNDIPDTTISTVIHIAGQSGGVPSWEDNVNDLESNALAGLGVINFAISRSIKNIIYTGSMAIYGNPLSQPVQENSKPNPLTPYAVSKLMVEYYLSVYREYFDKILILRLNNTYGHGQILNNMQQGMVRIFLSQAFNDRKIIVHGSLSRYRDFIYIDDVSNAIYLATISQVKGLETLNISNNVKTTVGELVDIIVATIPFQIEVTVSDVGTQGDQSGIYCDNSRAKTILDWEPIISLEVGIQRVVSETQKESGKQYD